MCITSAPPNLDLLKMIGTSSPKWWLNGDTVLKQITQKSNPSKYCIYGSHLMTPVFQEIGTNAFGAALKDLLLAGKSSHFVSANNF